MLKAFRHTGVLMMLGVVALGLVGAAYTLWYEDLVLETTIETGTLDADWSFHTWIDDGAEGSFSPTSGDGIGKPIVKLVDVSTVTGPGTNIGLTGNGQYIDGWTNAAFDSYGGKTPTKCTGGITSVGTAPADANDEATNNKLTLFAGGLFPYAGCEWQINIANKGSVPLHIAIQGVVVEECNTWSAIVPPATTPACATWIPVTNSPFSRAILGEDREFDSVGDDRVACWNVLGADWNLRNSLPSVINAATPRNTDNVGPPVQIHAEDEILCNLALVLDQRADAEGKTYRYTISWRTFQWNENPSGAAITAP